GGESGPYIPAGTTIDLPTPNWNTTLLGITLEGSLAWRDYGPVGTSIITAFTEGYGVALDPPGDVFLVGGTNTSAVGNTIYECGFGGLGAWIIKVSGADGSCIYEWTLEN